MLEAGYFQENSAIHQRFLFCSVLSFEFICDSIDGFRNNPQRLYFFLIIDAATWRAVVAPVNHSLFNRLLKFRAYRRLRKFVWHKSLHKLISRFLGYLSVEQCLSQCIASKTVKANCFHWWQQIERNFLGLHFNPFQKKLNLHEYDFCQFLSTFSKLSLPDK